MDITSPSIIKIVATGKMKEKEFMFPTAVVIDDAIFALNVTSESERNG